MLEASGRGQLGRQGLGEAGGAGADGQRGESAFGPFVVGQRDDPAGEGVGTGVGRRGRGLRRFRGRRRRGGRWWCRFRSRRGFRCRLCRLRPGWLRRRRRPRGGCSDDRRGRCRRWSRCRGRSRRGGRGRWCLVRPELQLRPGLRVEGAVRFQPALALEPESPPRPSWARTRRPVAGPVCAGPARPAGRWTRDRPRPREWARWRRRCSSGRWRRTPTTGRRRWARDRPGTAASPPRRPRRRPPGPGRRLPPCGSSASTTHVSCERNGAPRPPAFLSL